jgi:hypothetical protein
MNRIISERLAIAGVFTILSLVVLFHGLILTGVIPFDIVWGGRLTTREQMLRMESVSIGLNLAMLAVVGVRARFLGRRISPRMVAIALWLMAALFFLNTIGNLLSQNSLERAIFTPLTFLLSVLCVRLALGDRGRRIITE